MTNKSTKSGFTIIELMVSMAIAAILISVALPAFNGFITQRTMAARVNDFVLAVNYARSEAARLGGVVSVQASAAAADNEWGGGYCVVAGNPGDCDPPVLRAFAPLDDATLNGAGALNGRTTLSFNSRGMLLLALGADARVELCGGDAGDDPGREVRISAIGRPDANQLVCFP